MNDSAPTHDSSDSLPELVAYLDGEVTPEQRRALEQRLAQDEALRDELLGLQRSWDMLDGLPVADGGRDFTNTTMTLVVEELRPAQAFPWGKWLAYGLLASAIGFAVVAGPRLLASRQQASELPLIYNLHLYRYVDDLAEVRQLAELSELATPAEQSATAEGAADPEVGAGQAWRGTAAELEAYLDTVPVHEVDRLRRERTRFQELATDAQQQLAALHAEIENSTDRAALLSTLESYYEFLISMSSGERAEFLEMPGDQRIALIQNQSRRDPFRRPSDSDLVAVRDWVVRFIADHRSEIEAAVPAGRLSERRLRMVDRPDRLFGLLYGFSGIEDLPLPDETEFVSLLDQLSPGPRKQLEAAASEGRRQQLRMVAGILLVGTRRMRMSQEELQQFIQSISPELRAELERLSPEEMMRRARQLRHERFRGPGGPGAPGSPFGGPGSVFGGPGGPGGRPRDRERRTGAGGNFGPGERAPRPAGERRPGGPRRPTERPSPR